LKTKLITGYRTRLLCVQCAYTGVPVLSLSILAAYIINGHTSNLDVSIKVCPETELERSKILLHISLQADSGTFDMLHFENLALRYAQFAAFILRKPKGYVGSDVRFKNQNIYLTWGTPDTLAKSKYVKKFQNSTYMYSLCTFRLQKHQLKLAKAEYS